MSLAIYASFSKHLRCLTRPDTTNCTGISHATQANSANGWIARGASTCFLKSIPIFRAHHIIQDGIDGGAEVVKATSERVHPLVYVIIRRIFIYV